MNKMQLQILGKQILNDNEKIILALIYLAGTKVQRFSRLQLAMYALKTLKIHSYKFTEHSPWGPADKKFRKEIGQLCGFISFDRYWDNEGNKHGIYRLTPGGQIYAEEIVNQFQSRYPKKYPTLLQIARKLKDPSEGLTALQLYNEFIKK